MLRLRKSALVVLALLLAFAAACSNAESGVNVKTVATDLIYGIPPTPKPAPPPNVDTTPSDPFGVVKQGGDGPIRTAPPRTPIDPCPEAPPTVFPEAAPTEIRGHPAKGVYTWRVEGSQTVPAIGEVRLPEASDRTVVESATAGGGPRFVVQEKELIYGSQFDVRSTYEYRVGGVDESEEGINVDRTGLYLVKIERIHRGDESSNREFNPSPPILVLPTPVTLGDSVTSAGVDPVSFEVLRQEGAIVRRQRIDACGKPQDTFFAETFRDFVSASGEVSRVKYNYGISTVMGGLTILEHIESPCVDTEGECAEDQVTFTMDAHIGQLEPDK
jgi:hypothetical protein